MGNAPAKVPPAEEDGSFPKPRVKNLYRSTGSFPHHHHTGVMKKTNSKGNPPAIGVVASTDSVEVGPADTMGTVFSEDVEVGYNDKASSPNSMYGTGNPAPTYTQVNHRYDSGSDNGSVGSIPKRNKEKKKMMKFETLHSAPKTSQASPPLNDDDADGADKDGDHRGKKCFVTFSVLLFLAAIIAVAIIVPLKKGRKDRGPPSLYGGLPTSSPTYSDTRLGMILETIGEPWISDAEEGYPNNPHAVDAVTWLVDNDPAQLPVDGSVPPEVIRERYVMALLYYSTNGPNWTHQDNVLSDQPICTWYGVNCTTMTTKDGNGNDVDYATVTHLDLGKS